MESSFRELKKEIEHIKRILGNDCSIIQLKSATSDDITIIFTDAEGNDHPISCNITTVSTTTKEKNLNEPVRTLIFNFSQQFQKWLKCFWNFKTPQITKCCILF